MNNIFKTISKRRLQGQRGAAMLLFVIFFTLAMSAIVATYSRAVYGDVVAVRQAATQLQAEMTADAGVEDMTYRLIMGHSRNDTEAFSLAGVGVTTNAVFDATNDIFAITSTSTSDFSVRTSQLTLLVGIGASFNFGVQSGNGGFEMSNGSSVQGNAFSNGPISKVGGGTATVYGDVISAGPGGLIDDIRSTGDARARVIQDSDIDGDAYAYTLDGGIVDGDAYVYERIGGAVVGGTVYGHQPEESPADLPISDADIEAIKQDIIDNGTVIASTDPECAGGEYFTDEDITLGFVKIECDFRVKKKGSATVLTLTGSVWVEGDITFEGGPDVQIDGSVANKTVPIIADNPADRITSSRISIENGTDFTGSGSPKSYVLMISQNEDSETGGSAQDAISVGQSSAGDLLVYAAHGRVALGNSISLKEVTGYLIQLNNSAEVIYESGLVNLLFTSGPGGGYSILSWQDKE